MSSPYRHEILPERRAVHVRARGRSSFQLAEEAIRELARDPAFDPRFVLRVDLREIDYLPSNVEARAFGRLLSAFRNRIALVASEGVSFGVARMVAAFSELDDVDVQAFTTLEAADAWLAGPPDEGSA